MTFSKKFIAKSPFKKSNFLPKGLGGLAAYGGFRYLTDEDFREKSKKYIKDLKP